MMMAVAWPKEKNLLDQNAKWYQEKWTCLENSRAKLLWDFEFNLQKTTTSRMDSETIIWKVLSGLVQSD